MHWRDLLRRFEPVSHTGKLLDGLLRDVRLIGGGGLADSQF